MIKSVKKSNQELEEEFGPSDPLNSAEVQRGELEFFDRLAISALRIPTAYPVVRLALLGCSIVSKEPHLLDMMLRCVVAVSAG